LIPTFKQELIEKKIENVKNERVSTDWLVNGGYGLMLRWTSKSTPNDGPEKINIGTEYAFNNFLMLRGDYRFNYNEEGLTLGGGLIVRTSSWSFMFNYSYWDFGVLESINMFSISFGM